MPKSFSILTTSEVGQCFLRACVCVVTATEPGRCAADLTALLDDVRNSAVLTIVQSPQVYLRPWCLLELYAAVEADVPIIAIMVAGKGSVTTVGNATIGARHSQLLT